MMKKYFKPISVNKKKEAYNTVTGVSFSEN